MHHGVSPTRPSLSRLITSLRGTQRRAHGSSLRRTVSPPWKTTGAHGHAGRELALSALRTRVRPEAFHQERLCPSTSVFGGTKDGTHPSHESLILRELGDSEPSKTVGANCILNTGTLCKPPASLPRPRVLYTWSRCLCRGSRPAIQLLT